MDPLVTRWITALVFVIAITFLVYLFARSANREG